jgi:3-oxocholest-4-en-26-oate---CoA ligase
VKKRWMDVFTNASFTDSVGATETGFQGMGMQDKDQKISTDGPVVGLGPNSVVLDDDNRLLDPATDIGKIGRLGRGGNVPVGYYKDPEKSAATFLVIDGKRYSVPGDFARIEEGNRVTLLGRGSNCVNTGGEKVYPEEVEMAVKGHPAVYDCLVVGIPDEKYGQSVAAVVELRVGTTLELDELRDFLRAHLSGYKLPRSLTVVPQIPRNATGKAQYPAAKEMALAHVAV